MTPEEIIVREKMLGNDAFSQWLGIEPILIERGAVQLKMMVREEMTNGFKIAHGGIAFSIADSALAFASNSHGIQSVTIETTTSFVKPLYAGDVIIAKSREIQLSGKFARYIVEIFNQSGELSAVFYGTVFRTGKPWLKEGQ
ncbi:MAG: hotdog fold thioesterase [Saprospirales bacterium]|nr:MAG: hotdog fold thioesterase [Saprospirales bacterium]